jgi:hypothetical protein
MSVLFFTFANHMDSALMTLASGNAVTAFVATQALNDAPIVPKITSAALVLGAIRLKA